MKIIFTLILLLVSTNLCHAGLIIENDPAIIVRPKPTAKQIANVIKQDIERLYKSTKTQHTLIYNKIWNNPDATPDEIIKEFGSDGAALFQTSELLQQSMATADPTYEVMEPKDAQVTINPDGTVTIK